MGLEKSAGKVREAAEHETKSGKRRHNGRKSRQKADTAAAEAHPEVGTRDYGKAAARRR